MEVFWDPVLQVSLVSTVKTADKLTYGRGGRARMGR